MACCHCAPEARKARRGTLTVPVQVDLDELEELRDDVAWATKVMGAETLTATAEAFGVRTWLRIAHRVLLAAGPATARAA